MTVDGITVACFYLLNFSMDAKHPGHVNGYVLLIVKFAIFVISGPINFGFYSRMGFSA